MKDKWKYITPYFDNNIKAVCSNGITYEGKENISIIDLESGVKIHYNAERIKPILKPLISLQHDSDEDLLKFKYVDTYEYSGGVLFKDRLTMDGKNFKLDGCYYNATEMPWDFVDCLISKGYDVFRLIEQGKAIDINTI